MSNLIGIDASRAVSGAATGTEGYSYHLIRALLAALPEHLRVRLYFRELPPDTGVFPGAELCPIPFPRMWTHTRLSWEMLRHPPDALFVPAHVLPLARPRRALVTVHDLGYRYFPEAHPPGKRRYLDWSTRWNVWAASHVLADSQATRDAIVREYGAPASKITVAYPGYDTTLAPIRDPQVLAAVRARYGIPGDYILALGSIQPRKNLVRLINAFAQILERHPGLTLTLAGPDGWLSAPIVGRVKELGLEKRVLFPGYVAERDKAALISGARAFAFPSLYEGFGFPALEAQACGVPLLASNTSSLPEVTGEGALQVNPLDESAIAQGLRRLLEDATLRRELTDLGQKNLSRFSWATTAEIVLRCLRVERAS
ncbi:MAG: glycosyltransferase family 4 protein [Anaerolineae bacterium]|nr:glycosyltransferase family 4 protein [Anaerolineae bacterium]